MLAHPPVDSGCVEAQEMGDVLDVNRLTAVGFENLDNELIPLFAVCVGHSGRHRVNYGTPALGRRQAVG